MTPMTPATLHNTAPRTIEVAGTALAPGGTVHVDDVAELGELPRGIYVKLDAGAPAEPETVEEPAVVDVEPEAAATEEPEATEPQAPKAPRRRKTAGDAGATEPPEEPQP